MYVFYNPNPDQELSASDCVIRAFSKAFDMSWEQAYTLLSAQGFADHDVLASDRVWNNLLFDMGFKRHFINNTCPMCYTIADFARDNSHGTYILGTGKHAVCVSDSDIFDSWNSSKEVPLFFFKIRE